jgi:hypothetical protein
MCISPPPKDSGHWTTSNGWPKLLYISNGLWTQFCLQNDVALYGHTEIVTISR